jgi:hypothetical protein
MRKMLRNVLMAGAHAQIALCCLALLIRHSVSDWAFASKKTRQTFTRLLSAWGAVLGSKENPIWERPTTDRPDRSKNYNGSARGSFRLVGATRCHAGPNACFRHLRKCRPTANLVRKRL